MSNMEIWEAVSKTDPDYTKHVNQRGGFTAIDAHYQIMCATEQFGPVGKGWGYECQSPVFHDKFVIVPVVMWHGSRENTFGPVYGCAEMLGNRPDSDAPKKATTDAITKGLSQLGFNADVFLKKFDDNKYVEQVRAEFQEKKRTPVPPAALEAISGAETLESLQTVWKANRDWQLHPDFVKAKDDRKLELMADEPDASEMLRAG